MREILSFPFDKQNLYVNLQLPEASDPKVYARDRRNMISRREGREGFEKERLNMGMTGAMGDTAARIVRRLQTAGHEAYLVGGCVRDIFLGVAPEDYDIVTSARPEEVQALFDRTIPVGISFGVILVVEEGRNFEVATYRAEEDYDDGRRPSRVRFASAAEDVRRRDFTINGLLMDTVTGEVVDCVGGRKDIEERIIRTIGEPGLRFAEDHLRMLRAVRFAANLNFSLDPPTRAAIGEHAREIRRISAERVRDELNSLLTHGGARRGMELLADTRLLREILPEVAAVHGVQQPPIYHPEGDVWVHILAMLELLPLTDGKADARLAWGVVLHDTGKAVTRSEDASGVHFYGHVRRGAEIAESILRRLRLSNTDVETVVSLVREHMLFMNVREMRPNRLKRFLRMPDFTLHLELHRLDPAGTHRRPEVHGPARRGERCEG